MKSGIPWQVAEVGRSGGREPANPSHRQLPATYRRDRPDEDGSRHGAGSSDARATGGATPTAMPAAIRAGAPNTAAVDTLRGELAEIRLVLDEAAPQGVIEALQNEINKLAERVEDRRRDGVDAAVTATIARRLAEIRDALCALRPAESLRGLVRVVQQLSRKIDIMAAAWDPTVLEQAGSAVATMRGIVSQAASQEALAKLSEEVRALGAGLDDAQSRADGTTVAMLESRVAMLADQIQARDRSVPNVPVELAMLIERLIGRIERMEPTSGSSAAPAGLESLIAKLVEKLDACGVRLDQVATIERVLAELLTHVERWHAPTLAREAVPSPAVEALSRHVADLRQAEEQIEELLEVAHGTLAHVVDRLVMIETDLRGKPSQVQDAAPPPGTVVPPLDMPAAPQASLPPAGRTTRPEQCAIDPYAADADVPPDSQKEPGSGVVSDPHPDPSLNIVTSRRNPPLGERDRLRLKMVAAHRPSSPRPAAPRRWKAGLRRVVPPRLKPPPTIIRQGRPAR